MHKIKLILYWIFDQFIFPWISALMPLPVHEGRVRRIIDRFNEK